MNVTLSGEIAEYVSQKIASGQYPTATDVVHDALRLLREQEEKQQRLDELRGEIAIGIRQADEGKVGPLNATDTLVRIRQRRTHTKGNDA